MQVTPNESKRPGRPRSSVDKRAKTLRLRATTLAMIDAVRQERAIDSVSGAIDQLVLSHPWTAQHRNAPEP